MVTFSQFCDEVTQFLGEPVNCRNWTTEKDCGHTLNLYEAQTYNGFTAIEYTQGLDWAFHFNGYVGIGRTLQEADADHTEKYRDYMQQ
jgi:hypothetical protein